MGAPRPHGRRHGFDPGVPPIRRERAGGARRRPGRRPPGQRCCAAERARRGDELHDSCQRPARRRTRRTATAVAVVGGSDAKRLRGSCGHHRRRWRSAPARSRHRRRDGCLCGVGRGDEGLIAQSSHSGVWRELRPGDRSGLRSGAPHRVRPSRTGRRRRACPAGLRGARRTGRERHPGRRDGGGAPHRTGARASGRRRAGPLPRTDRARDPRSVARPGLRFRSLRPGDRRPARAGRSARQDVRPLDATLARAGRGRSHCGSTGVPAGPHPADADHPSPRDTGEPAGGARRTPGDDPRVPGLRRASVGAGPRRCDRPARVDSVGLDRTGGLLRQQLPWCGTSLGTGIARRPVERRHPRSRGRARPGQGRTARGVGDGDRGAVRRCRRLCRRPGRRCRWPRPRDPCGLADCGLRCRSG